MLRWFERRADSSGHSRTVLNRTMSSLVTDSDTAQPASGRRLFTCRKGWPCLTVFAAGQLPNARYNTADLEPPGSAD